MLRSLPLPVTSPTRYLLDMEATSPAGGIFRRSANNTDGTQVSCCSAQTCSARASRHCANAKPTRRAWSSSHREGLRRAACRTMACGVVGIALDYCSGTEICGDRRGVMVNAIDYTTVSTWGGALDKHPDIADLTSKLQMLYGQPRRAARDGEARHGVVTSADVGSCPPMPVMGVLERVAAERKQPRASCARDHCAAAKSACLE